MATFSIVHVREALEPTSKSFPNLSFTDEPLPPGMRPPGHIEYRVLSEQSHNGIKVVTIECVEQPAQESVDVRLTIPMLLSPSDSV